MRNLKDIESQLAQTDTVAGLTRAFEGIASMRISQTRDQTLLSGLFFADLWQIYRQIRVDFFSRRASFFNQPSIKKELIILITSEGGLSGDVDSRLIREALKVYKPELHDIAVIGSHGAQLLRQSGINYIKSYVLPPKEVNISVQPLLAEVQKYRSTVVFYESYSSIMTQEIKTIQLAQALVDRGKQIEKRSEAISEQNYIFEPSVYEVVEYMEGTMVQIMLGELILESRLAQYASRFKAMGVARRKASDALAELIWNYNRLKRYLKDDKLKSVISNRQRLPL